MCIWKIPNVASKKVARRKRNLLRTINQAYLNGDDNLMRRIIKSRSINLIVEVIESLEDLKIIQFILLCAIGTKIGALFNALPLNIQEQVVEHSHYGLLKLIFDDMFSNDIVDLMQKLPKSLEKKILLSTSTEVRKKINSIANYPVNEAGGIMNPEFLALKSSQTILEAIRFIRDHRDQYESYSICYVVEHDSVLKGYVELDDLIFADSYDTKIGDITRADVVSVSIEDTIDTLSGIFEKYSLIRVAVVNDKRQLLGIIYANDVLPAMAEINQKQLFHMAGIAETKSSYIESSVWRIVRSRIGWLIILSLITTLTTFVIQQFTSKIGSYSVNSLMTLLLVPLLTAVCGKAGNAGTQTATSIIRSLAMGELSKKDYGKAFLKEFYVAIILALLLCLFNFARLSVLFLWSPPDIAKYPDLCDKLKITSPYLLGVISAAIGTLALFILIIFSKMLGVVLPLIAVKCKIDPSVMASPLIATVLDTISALILFGVGIFFVGLLVK